MTEPFVGEGRTVLIADDDESSMMILSELLESRGLSVVRVMDGEQALGRVEETSPDLIFLDVMMPKLDGYALLMRLKGNEKTSGIPVVIVSGLPREEQKSLAESFGAVDFIQKPFRIADVIGKVAEILG